MVRKILLWEFIPELMALVFYSLPFGSLVMYIEATRLGFTIKQICLTHFLFLAHYVVFHLCAKKKDALARRIGQVAASVLALCLYGLPIFFVSALLARTSLKQAFGGVLVQAIINICFGWLYYLILRWTREYRNAILGIDQIE